MTGATGTIGGALIPVLLARGRRVRCLVREPDRLVTSWRHRVDVVAGAVEDPAAVERAAAGCQIAYYLVHGLTGPLTTLVARERAAARSFRVAVERAGVDRVVYLGGLVDEDGLAQASEHLYARQQVGEELRAGRVAVTELRAGVVLTPDSASVRLLLVAARSPVQVWGDWASRRVQPIALEDLLELLVLTGEDPRAARAVLDVGGPDVVTYEHLVDLVRAALGRPPARTLRLPHLPVELAAGIAAARAGLDPQLTLSLLQSVDADTIVREPRCQELYPGVATTPTGAVLATLVGRR